MAGFDINAAKEAGYSDAEIQAELQRQVTQQGRNGPLPPVSRDPGALPQYSPLRGMSEWDQTLAGAGRGMVHIGNSAGNLVGLVPDSTLQDEKAIDAPLLSTGAGRFGNLVGETAVTAPLGMGAGAVAGRYIPALAGAVPQGVIQGATQGALTSDPGQRGVNTLVGALTGGGLAGAGRAGSTLVNGLPRTPEAQRLLNQGVDLTPGQMNPRGTWNQMEQGGEHVPFVSPMVEAAREQGEHGWQAAVFQEGAAPGTTITPSSDMHDMLDQAYRSYQPLYDKARGIPVHPAVMNGTQGVKLGPLFDQAAALPGTTQDAQNAARSWLQNELTRLPQTGVKSDDLLTLRSNIRQELRQARLSTDTMAQDKAKIYSMADQIVTRSLNSQLPPASLAALQTADKAYSNYKLVENAVAASKDQVAGLTPQKLSQAVYNATPDQSYALGAGGNLRQLAKDGVVTFQQKVPPNGASVLTMGSAAALGAHSPLVAIPASAGGAALTLTPTGRRIAQGVTGPQLQAQRLVGALTNAVPPAVRRNLPSIPGGYLTQGAIGATAPAAGQYIPQALAAALMAQQQPH